MATSSSPSLSKEEETQDERQDAAGRLLQLLKQWPHIMELMDQEKVPASQLQRSFETLTEILQQVADTLPEHTSTAMNIIQKILHVYITHVYHALNGSNPSTVIMSALNLLVAMVTYSREAAREVMATINVQHGVFMTLVNRANLKVEDDIRGCCLRLAMAFFVSTDNKVIKQMLMSKDFLKSFFKKLGQDRASNIKLLLVTLSQYVVCNPAVTKTEKLHILNDYTLQQVAALYRWRGANAAKLIDEAQPEDDFQTLEVRQLCHQFLLKVTCDLKYGISFFDGSLGLSGKNCNLVLLKFLLGLHSAVDDELVQELVVSILHACPDLLNSYLSKCKLSFHPRPSPSWLVNMKLLEKILSGQPVVPSALKQARNTSTGYMVQLAMVNIIPVVLNPVLLSQAVKHSSPVVRCRILEVIRLILKRADKVMQWLKKSEQTTGTVSDHRTVMSQFQQALIKALPDVDAHVNLLHKTLDAPGDVDQNQSLVKTQELDSAEQEMEQGAEVNLVQPKKEDLLTVLFDVLCAYHQTIPASFAQTNYDFSRLPHMIEHAKSVILSDTIEQRALQLLLAFPEGKLRGFKEVRGDDGSTVLLLLKQLTSGSGKSDLQSVKIKLLTKFIRETGLFAQSEWEIAEWLNHLTLFGPDEASRIVNLFYKSLTQAIRNPYPFNDRVIQAMNSACTFHQHERVENMSKQDVFNEDTLAHHLAASPDVLTLLSSAASSDLDEDYIMVGEPSHTASLPCSALLPSALQVFTQLEQDSQSLFGQYVSSVAVAIIDRQENPVSVCLLLHHYSQTDGTCITQDVSWQVVMEYYAMWLPPSYRTSTLYKKSGVCLTDRAILKTRNEWSWILHASILRGEELSASDEEVLLSCDEKELLPMIRQLLMYVHTVHAIQPKKVSAVLSSYLSVLETVLERVHSEHDQQEKDIKKSDSDGIVAGSDYRHKAPDDLSSDWWIDVAEQVLQHQAFQAWFGSDTENLHQGTETCHSRQDLQALNAVVMSCFLKCLGVFKQHLPSNKLKQLLQPIIKASFQNFLDLLSNKRNVNTRKPKTEDFGDRIRSAVEMFQEMCYYSDDVQLADAVSVVLKTLNDEKVSAASSKSKYQHRLKVTLCHLFRIAMNRQKASKLEQSANTTAIMLGEVLNTTNISTLVKLAHRFNCDEMISLLSHVLEESPELTSVFTRSIFTSWLDNPSEVKSNLLSLLVKESKSHSDWFEDWCEENSIRLTDSKDVRLAVVLMYCSRRLPETGNRIIGTLCSAYWSWLQEWLLQLKTQEDSEGGNQTKMMGLLSHLLKHSGGDTVHKFLHSLVRQGHGTHAPYNRSQLQAIQLAINRLACHDCTVADEKTQGILVEVLVTCLQSLVSMIKTSPENPASAIGGYLLSVSAVLKAVEAQSLLVSPALIQVWKSLVRNGLRHYYQSAEMLQLIASLVKLMYSQQQHSAKDMDLDSHSKNSSSLLPLSLLYQIVLSHSLCLPTLLEEHDISNNYKGKESLVLLMLTMVELEPQCCHKAHYTVLVGAYHATMSLTDTTLLTLMQHYQINQAVPSNYSVTAWGRKAVSLHQTQKALGKSLWQQPSMKEILQQLEVDILRDSALQFPLYRKLQAPDFTTSGVSPELYDPCFLLPLFSQLLASDCVVDCCQFIETNALFLTLAGLSSYDTAMRQAAYHILASFLGHLEAARFRGRREVNYLLQCLRNSISERNMRVPCVLGVFVARAATLMLTPEHFMYPILLQYLLIKPQLQMNAVPLFARLFYSSSFKHEDECQWMLSLLIDGLRDSTDVLLYQKNSIFSTLMAFCQSKLASKQAKDTILSLLDRAFGIEDVRDDLIAQLLPCFQASVTSADHYSGEGRLPTVYQMLRLHPESGDGGEKLNSTSPVSASVMRTVVEFTLPPL